MRQLIEMSYEEFGKLRFLDFFPRTDRYVENHEGGLESGIGLSCCEGYGIATAFLSPEGPAWQTSEVQLTFENNECPEAEGSAFLAKLGLRLRKGIGRHQVREIMGHPVKEFPSAGLDFIIGREWPYYVGCSIKDTEGLFAVWICRKDLADAQTE